MDLSFKKYLGLSQKEKNLLSPNSGTAHHQTVSRIVGSGLDRKNPYLVAKTHTEKKHLHPKVTQCLNQKKKIPLTPTEASDIMKAYNGINPNPEEPIKSIKQLPVSLQLVSPNVYILIPTE
jgi:hypothetical protein